MSSSYHKTAGATAALKLKLRNGTINMAGEIVRLSTTVTPWKDGDLRKRRTVTPRANGARIVWSSRHAAVQNAGRRAGSRPFRNYTTPGTGAHFVEAGIKAVQTRGLGSYFR